MGYCDHTDAEVFALTRLRRRERAVAVLKAKYGETVKASGETVEYDGPHWFTQEERRANGGLIVCKVERSLRRHAKKEARRNRPKPRFVMSEHGPHTRYLSKTMFEKLRGLQGNACYLCRREFTPDDDATQDHVTPREPAPELPK